MLSPEYLETIGEGGEEIAELLHHEIMQQIVERIAIRLDRGDNYILTARDKWQIQVLQDAGYLREDIEKLLAKYTGLMQKEIAEAMEAAGVRNMEWDDAVYRAAGLSPAALSQSPYLVRLMQRTYEATAGEWVNFTRTTADACQQSFVAACDKAYNMVSSGAMGYSQAFVDAIKDLADEGVAVVKYTKIDPISGEEKVHTDTIETATLRCIRTGVSQATAQITDARMDEMNWDIILVSSHFGARVTANEDFTNHYWWQGKFYSKSGKDLRFPPFSVCGFGHVQGIHGANCRHHKGPGDGEHNPFREYDREENKKECELQQKQRSKERRIRKTKQQCVTLKKAMDSAGTEESKQKLEEAYQKKAAILGRQNEDYNDFCEENNLKRRSERLQIAKWDREQARASIKAAEKTKPNNSKNVVDNLQKNDKIVLQRLSEKPEEGREKPAIEEIVKKAIEAGEVSAEINPQKQNRHILGTPEYKAGKSYIFGTIENAQSMVNALCGTGQPVMKADKWQKKERVVSDTEIGVYIDPKTKEKITTKYGMIVYSKTGSHIYPRKGE